MALGYKSIGATPFAVASGALTHNYPATKATGDLFVLFIETSETGASSALPSGSWNKIGEYEFNPDGTQARRSKMQVYYWVYDGTGTNVTIAQANDNAHILACIYSYSVISAGTLVAGQFSGKVGASGIVGNDAISKPFGAAVVFCEFSPIGGTTGTPTKTTATWTDHSGQNTTGGNGGAYRPHTFVTSGGNAAISLGAGDISVNRSAVSNDIAAVQFLLYGVEPFADVELSFPSFDMAIAATSRYTITSALTFPKFDIDVDADVLSVVDTAYGLNFPPFDIAAAVDAIPGSVIGLNFPPFAMAGEIGVEYHLDIDASFPPFGMKAFVGEVFFLDIDASFPPFDIAAEVQVSNPLNEMEFEFAFPAFKTAGEILNPPILLDTHLIFPAFKTAGEILNPPIVLDVHMGFPKFRMAASVSPPIDPGVQGPMGTPALRVGMHVGVV